MRELMRMQRMDDTHAADTHHREFQRLRNIRTIIHVH
jgi:hypothetical protein